MHFECRNQKKGGEGGCLLVFSSHQLKTKNLSCGDGKEVFSIQVSHYSSWGYSGKGRPRVTPTSLQVPACITCWPGQVSPGVRLSQGGLGLEFCRFFISHHPPLDMVEAG